MKGILPEKTLRTFFAGFLILSSVSFFPSLAILPKFPSGSGGYHVIPFGEAYITAIYDNTEACSYGGGSSLCASGIQILNSSDYIGTSSKMIFTDKPVVVNFRYIVSYGCYNLHLPSSSEVKKEYTLISENNAYIVAMKYYTQVNVSYPNGTLMANYSLTSPGDYVTIQSPQAGTKINSDKPVFVYEGFVNSNYGRGYTIHPGGTEFYIDSRRSTVYISPFENSTTVYIDQDRDGITDSTYILYTGDELSVSGLEVGTQIKSDKTIFVISKDGNMGYSFINYSFAGNEYYIPYAGCGGTRYIYITPIHYKTNVKILDKTGSVVDEYNFSLPSDYVTLTNPTIGYRIVSDKPVIVTSYSYYAYNVYRRISAYILRPLSPTTLVKSPFYIGLNEYVTIKTRFFNPTSETLYNISIDTYSHKNFTLVGDTGVVNITVYKKNASTDSVIAQSFMQKSYSLSGDENVFTVSYADSSLLSSLKTDEYIELEFEVMANSPGYYSFRAESTWKATYWA